MKISDTTLARTGGTASEAFRGANDIRIGRFVPLYTADGKKEIVVDLNQERGREIVRGVIGQSDVLAESFTPRVMRAFELDYERVREIRPDIVMISLSGYGQDGPYADWAAYGMHSFYNCGSFIFFFFIAEIKLIENMYAVRCDSH